MVIEVSSQKGFLFIYGGEIFPGGDWCELKDRRERDETSWKEHGGVEGNGGIRGFFEKWRQLGGTEGLKKLVNEEKS